MIISFPSLSFRQILNLWIIAWFQLLRFFFSSNQFPMASPTLGIIWDATFLSHEVQGKNLLWHPIPVSYRLFCFLNSSGHWAFFESGSNISMVWQGLSEETVRVQLAGRSPYAPQHVTEDWTRETLVEPVTLTKTNGKLTFWSWAGVLFPTHRYIRSDDNCSPN